MQRNNDKSMWEASISVKGRKYLLSRSKDINSCIDSRKLAEKRYENGNFGVYYE